MDHKDWVLQGGKGRVNCSGFPCPRWNISVSHPFLHAGCQRLFVAGCSKVVSWSRTLMATSQLRIECVTSCVTVMVMYYLWSTTMITTLLSIFIHPTMSSDITIVSHLNDWHKTLTWALTASRRSGWSLRASSNALSTMVSGIHIYPVCPVH